MSEAQYQAQLVRNIKRRFGARTLVIKNDANRIQGIPDLLVLLGPLWFALEVKLYSNSPRRPNQEWYVAWLNEQGYAAFIYPENEEAIFDEMEKALRAFR